MKKELVSNIYSKVNSELMNNPHYFNTAEFREGFALILKGIFLINHENIDVICDETNNVPQIIDMNLLGAKIIYDRDTTTHKFVDLIFGRLEQVMRYENSSN